MKFKKGDKVRVRQWKAMEREYGLDENGDINLSYRFTSDMSDFCGKIVTISDVYKKYFGMRDHDKFYDWVYKIEEDGGVCRWLNSMFEGYAFEYGDEIEVSDDEECWERGFYIGYLDGFHLPYACATGGDREAFAEGKKFHALFWKYARPIQKHRIVIDGKEIEISEESYKKLKESLLK